MKPAFESKTSIVFSIFVANEQNGHGLFRWDKSYRVVADSSLVAGFGIDTSGDSSELRNKLDAMMKSHLPAFQKAVRAP
jgi:hypothetical protein